MSNPPGLTDQKCAPTFREYLLKYRAVKALQLFHYLFYYLVPWRSNNRDCSSCRSEYENFCPKMCGLGGYCCRNTYGGCPYGADKASPHKHTCVTVKDDITEGITYFLKT